MNIRIILILYLFLLSNTEDAPKIDFSSALQSMEGVGYSLKEDYLIINTYSYRLISYIDGSYFDRYTNNRFVLTGTNMDKTIIINSTSFIYLNSLTLTSKGTSIIIEKNCQVELILRGKSSLINSAVNENMGNIYLKQGAKLTISGPGTLNLIVNKFFGIYGEDSSSFEMNGGTLKIISTENSVGGIHINGDIQFNSPYFYYEDISGEKPVVSTNQSIVINSGNFDIISSGTIFQAKKSIIINSGNFDIISNGTIFQAKKSIIINSGNFDITSESSNFSINAGNSIYIKQGSLNIKSFAGNGIHAEENIYLGIKDEDNNLLKLNITSSGKGLEAQRIEIFSGNITIESKNDGIGILNDYCKEDPLYANTTCYIKIYGGDILINSEKNGINSVGNIYIAGGKTVIYAGENYSTIIESKLLKITKGIFFAGGANGFEENITETTQTFLLYNKPLAANSVISIHDMNNLASEIKLKKDIDYFYINYPSNYELKIDEYQKETNLRILKTKESQHEDEKFDDINLTEKIEKENEKEITGENDTQNNINTFNGESDKSTHEKKENDIYSQSIINNNIKENISLTEKEHIPKMESTTISYENIQSKKTTTNLLKNENIENIYNSEKLETKLSSTESNYEKEELKQNQKTDTLNNYESNENSSFFLNIKNLLIVSIIGTIIGTIL